MARKKIAKFSPGRIILYSLIGTILIGTLLLSLPIAQHHPVSVLDTFFTATSVTTVTGLIVQPITDFTPFGQTIIFLLMQIGGLGLITMTLFIISLFVNFGLTTQLLAGQMLEVESWKNIRELIIFIIKISFLTEALGAVLTFVAIRHDFPLHQAFFYSVFHSVSAFCNAGLSMFPEGMAFYQQNSFVLITTMGLMLIGGLGFITIHEVIAYIASLRSKKRFCLSLNTKIVLYAVAVLFSSFAISFWFLEREHTLRHLPWHLAFINALFNALSFKSTGFTTVPAVDLQFATLFLTMIISFIGSSPGSTGSGIKTTTLTIFIATIKAAIIGKNDVEIRNRNIAKDQVNKALAIIALSIAWICCAIFCLLITEPHWEFLDIAFEVVSAFATLGLSTGVTPYLSTTGKLFITLTMIIGRIGSLTFLLALKKHVEQKEFSYPKERVMLG